MTEDQIIQEILKDIVISTAEMLVGIERKRILEPYKGDIVYIKSDGSYIPVKIIDGAFFRNGRVSNFWYWENLETGEKEHGYGVFYSAKGGEW